MYNEPMYELAEGEDGNPKQNCEGYSDMTPYEAEERIEYERQRRRVSGVIKHIMYICNLAGYQVENRIVLRDKRNGAIWR